MQIAMRLKQDRKAGLLRALNQYAQDKSDAQFAVLFEAVNAYNNAGDLLSGWCADHRSKKSDSSATLKDLKESLNNAAALYLETANQPDEQFHHLHAALQAYAETGEGKRILRKQETRKAFLKELQHFLVERGTSGLDSLMEKMEQYHIAALERGMGWGKAHASAKKNFKEEIRKDAEKEAFPDPADVRDKGKIEEIVKKRAAVVDEKARIRETDGSYLKERMEAAMVRYCSGTNGRYQEAEFHALYHAVVAFGECEQGKAERKRIGKAVATPLSQYASAYAGPPFEPPLMQQQASSDAEKLLKKIRGSSTTFIDKGKQKKFKALAEMAGPLENRATREYVVSGLASGFSNIPYPVRQNALVMMRDYMAPVARAGLPPAVVGAMAEDRRDLLLTDTIRARAAILLLKAGLVLKDYGSRKAGSDFHEVLRLGVDAAKNISNADLKMQVLTEAVLAIHKNHTAVLEAPGTNEEAWSHAINHTLLTLKNEAQELHDQGVLAYHRALTGRESSDYPSLTSTASAVARAKIALQHFLDLKYVPIPHGREVTDPIELLIKQEEVLLKQISNLSDNKEYRQKMEADLPSSYLESQAFKRTGEALSEFEFGKQGRKLDLEEYALQQRQVDSKLIEKEVRNNPEVYRAALAAKHQFDEAWETVNLDTVSPDDRKKAVDYLSGIPELQALMQSSPHLRKSVVALLENNPALRAIFNKKLDDLISQRLAASGQRDAVPGYDGMTGNPR